MADWLTVFALNFNVLHSVSEEGGHQIKSVAAEATELHISEEDPLADGVKGCADVCIYHYGCSLLV